MKITALGRQYAPCSVEFTKMTAMPKTVFGFDAPGSEEVGCAPQ